MDRSDGAATAPLALARAPRRLTAAPTLLLDTPRPEGADAPGFAWRLATAARQDVWRALRRARGLAPLVCVTLASDRLRLEAAAGALDLAPAAPGALDALAEILHDAAIRDWTRWAARGRGWSGPDPSGDRSGEQEQRNEARCSRRS